MYNYIYITNIHTHTCIVMYQTCLIETSQNCHDPLGSNPPARPLLGSNSNPWGEAGEASGFVKRRL